MALVYKRSGKKAARAYDRSKGMEPNPGVSALTVVSNPSKRRTSRGVKDNPFQWIEGRGQRHRHVSPEYETLKGAARWKKRNKGSEARLYPVDRRGTIVSRPVDSRLLDNGGSEMPYNIGALKRAMRSNPKKRVKANRTKGGVKVKSRGKRRTTRNKKRSTVRRKSRPTKRNSKRRTSRKPKSNRARRSSRRRSRKPRRNSKRRSSKRRAPKRNSRRRSSKRRSSRKPKRNSRRRSSKRRSSKRRAPKRNSRRRSSKRRSSRKPRRNRSTRRRTSKKKGKTRYFGKRKVGMTGREFIDKYLDKGRLPTVAPRYRTGKSKSGIPPVLVYPIAKGRGKTTKRKTSRSTKSSRGPRTRNRARPLGASYFGGRKRKVKRNSRRRSSKRRSSRRRKTRRNSKRRSSRKPKRNSRRRSSKRRSSRRKVRKNLLSTTKARWGGRGKHRKGRPVGKTVQVLAYGPGSRTKSGGKLKGYPVYIPGHVIETAAVRRYKRLGGAALDSHRRAKRRGYRERKKYPKRRVRKNSRRKTSMRKNRRKSRRKSTRRNSRRRSSRRRSSRRRRSRRNPKYVVANKRRRRSSKRRRRPRKNQGIYGADIMKDVVTPVLGGTVGFVSARVLSNGLANVEGLRKILDKDKPAAEATNTKIAANVLGIVATLGLAPRVDIIKRNQGSLITGMGLALTDRLLGMVTGDAAAYLGEYVTQPLGEYVTQPLGEYVTQPLGAYTDDTLYAAAGLGFPVMEAAAGMGAPVLEAAAGYHEGVDPGNQASIDGMMDGMEGAMYATAGMGETMYATAGLGAEADAELKAMYARNQPPFASIQTPTDLAKRVTAGMPYAKPVPDTLVTPEGKGYAGGLFARNLFAGML